MALTIFQAHQVHGGAVIETTRPLRRAKRVLVPKGTQGVVQGAVYLPVKNTVRFSVKWAVGGEDISVPVTAKHVNLVEKGEDPCD